MTAKFQELVAKLKEIFQLDKPELDFGIYRIMHMRAKEIGEFLEKRLAEKVRTALAGNSAAEKSALEKELNEAIKSTKALGFDPEQSPKVQELRAKLGALGGDDEAEASVYSHLLTFFSRYYDDGDFISKRRYKDGVYAIPYAGEEVKLHWANADQYYIKSGENFQNYSFKLDDGARVSFKLVTAETAKDNIKDNDAVRCFVLWNPDEAANVEDEERAASLPKTILEDVNGELVIYFQYLKFKKGTKQADLIKDAQEKIAIALGQQKLLTKYNVLALAPTEKEKKRTVLGKHLQQYVAKNTSDYFIHKDLKGFLTRELDFYIKNEMMHLDDVMSAESFKVIEQNLRKIQAVRTIATELIAFMAQLEDFQKKLWLKKKFVTQCDYCLTMDRIPEELCDEVFANEKQQAEWKRLGFPVGRLVSAAPQKKQGDLFDGRAARPAQPLDARMVDTKFFSETFKSKLLRAIPDLDEQCGGLLIHADNYHAVNFIGDRYQGRLKTVYIDPPYNAKTSEILYKNTFKHSSWMSLIACRLRSSLRLFNKDTVQVVAIDEVEQERLGYLLSMIFPEHEKACVSVMHNHRGQQGKNVSYVHEFAFYTYFSDAVKSLAEMKRAEVDSRTLRDSGLESDRSDAATCFYPFYVKDGKIIDIGDIPPDEFHPGSNNIIREDGTMEIWPIDDSGNEKKWRYSCKTVGSIMNKLVIEKGRKAYQVIFNKDTGTMRSLWEDARYDASEYGTKKLQALFGVPYWKRNAETLYPKSLFTVRDSISVAMNGNTDGLVLDYFAGSGTTAHAVIALNREDGGNRKYILVEMGDHFDTVLKPRIEKVVYSADWKDGKPTAAETGISHCFKYMTLESYEDALNNIELEDKGKGLMGAMRDEYLIGYMMDLESKGSLISTDDFRHPFDYKLKIAVDSSGASEARKIDLVETFNYLIGLKVVQYLREIDKGYVTVEGTSSKGEKTLVVWRDVEKVDNVALNKLLGKLGVNPSNTEFDVVYMNGDHAVANMTLDGNDDGKVLKVRQIENEFMDRMFENV